jgi:hypothetical protein
MVKLTGTKLLALFLCIYFVAAVKLEKGWLTLDVSTGDQSE